MSDLRLTETAEFLRASHIKRWGIVLTHDQQSIATHMYRVWTLVRQWGPRIGLAPDDQRLAEEWALTHDLPEIRTGDMPTPHKTPEVKRWLQRVEYEIYPPLGATEEVMHDRQVADFCKFCDTAESILYLSANGAGAHATSVTRLLTAQMQERLTKSRLSAETQEILLALFNDTMSLT